jgi:TPR repeat protein
VRYDGRMTCLRPMLIAIAVSLAALSTPASAQDFQRGLEAYVRGDFATALREWRPLAEQGLADAQFNLGFMYRNGDGVPQDDTEAVRWYRLAAYSRATDRGWIVYLC